MSLLKKKCQLILEFFSIILAIISHILYFVQSIINQNFINYKSKEIITERLLYEKFSEEIYSNIHSYPIYSIHNKTKKSINPIDIQVKLDMYFDCQNVDNGLLNEEKCQNQIVNNLTCCKSDCCYKDKNGETVCTEYNFNIKKSYLDKRILNYNDEEIFDDPRRRYCQYTNNLSGTTSRLLDYNLEFEKFYYTYENILLIQNRSKNIKVGKSYLKNNIEYKNFIDCGEIDSLKNHLFLKDIKCPINYVTLDTDNNILIFDSIEQSSLGIFVKNYLSEIPPLIHEWDKTEFNAKDEEYNEKKKVSNKNINELMEEKNENYYYKQDAFFYINQIPDFTNKYINKINNYQKIYWYTTNFIGFDTAEDLEKFKKIFNEDDISDNPLYKIRLYIRPAIETSIISIIILAFYIIYLFILAYDIKKQISKKNSFFKMKEIITFASLIAYFFGYLTYTQNKFEKIEINLDINYKEILRLYNNRRMQKCLLIGIIIHLIASVYEIYYIFSKINKKNKKAHNAEIDINSDNYSSNNNNSNVTQEDIINRRVDVAGNSSLRKAKNLISSIASDEKINKIIKFKPSE